MCDIIDRERAEGKTEGKAEGKALSLIHILEQVITLQTKRSTYQMKVGDYGVLLHLYYGARVEDCTMDYLLHKKDVGFSGNPYDAGEDRTFSLDTLPQEFPSYGVGDYRNTCVAVSYTHLDAVITDWHRRYCRERLTNTGR